MVSFESLPEELGYLKFLFADRNAEYRQCKWLSNPFEDEIWTFTFGKWNSLSIDFRVKLEDGSLLTDTSNRELLETFKCWFCIQTHFDVTGGYFYTEPTANESIRRVASLIDYFLLHAPHFQLSKFGLTNVTENDIINLMQALASSREIVNSIYRWPEMLTGYLRKEIKKIEIEFLNEIILEHSFLSENIPDESDRMLSLSHEEITLARAMLWHKGYYRPNFRSTSSTETFRFALNTNKLAPLVYPNTLRGYTKKPQPAELLLAPSHKYSQEYKRASVKHSELDIQSDSEWREYRKTLRSLGHLSEIGLKVPIFALSTTRTLLSPESAILKSRVRFKTLSHQLVLDALKNAIEFSMDYGEDILKSALNVIEAAQKANLSCVSFTKEFDINPFLTPKIREIGVKVWHLGFHMNNELQTTNLFDTNRASSQDYFNRLRNNEGLYDLVRVLFGAIQICIGALMARRQSELMDLLSGHALDKSRTNLIFLNRKSDHGEMREKLVRPIPPIAVKLIELIEEFHKGLKTIGLGSEKIPLFSYPDVRTGKPVIMVSRLFNASIDIFCDYIQTALNEKGERYYIRQHQLRRFFAMMFFWGNSFGGIESLRWFLGHTDIEHVYHYITESTPGYMLRATKAHFGSEVLRTNPNQEPELADITEKHFGTRDFSVLTSEELDDYIEDLLTEGKVKIEPIFFEGPEGKSYRIAIKVLNTLSEVYE